MTGLAAIGPLLVGAAGTAGTASAGLFGFGGSLSALGIVSMVSTGIGLATNIAGINQQAGEARQAEYDARMQAKMEQLRGLQEGNRIRRALVEELSWQRARAGAAGIAGSSPLLAQQEGQASSDAAYELGIVTTNSELRRRQMQLAASSYGRASRPSLIDYGGAVASSLSPLMQSAIYRGVG